MRTFWMTVLFLASSSIALAGGGDYRDMPQQQMSPPVVVIPQPIAKEDSNPLVPVAVAVVGAAGLVGAAYVSGRRKKEN